MRYYQLAAVQGHAEALFNLGKERGGGREEERGGREGAEGGRRGGGGVGYQINHEKAMTYYQLAAVQGHAEALFHLGSKREGEREGGGEGEGEREREGREGGREAVKSITRRQ